MTLIYPDTTMQTYRYNTETLVVDHRDQSELCAAARIQCLIQQFALQSMRARKKIVRNRRESMEIISSGISGTG